MAVRIIIDSTCDASSRIKDRLITVPLTINFGDEEFIDGVTIDHKSFYEKLIESDVMPTTSQATPAAFDACFKQVADTGDTAVVLTVASKLSGTYQSAVIAAGDYPGIIYVVDSHTVAIGCGILAEYALKLADSGLSAAQIAESVTQVRDKVQVIAMLDTLEYLKRGGRISKTAAIAGGLLSIKPVVCIRDGEIIILGKARGSKQGNNLLVKEIESAGGIDFSLPLLMGYTGLSDLLLKKYIEDSHFLWEGNVSGLESECIGSVVGTHAGPGAIAAAFFSNP